MFFLSYQANFTGVFQGLLIFFMIYLVDWRKKYNFAVASVRISTSRGEGSDVALFDPVLPR